MRCIVPPLLLLLTASATVTAPEQAPPAKLQTSTPAPTLSPADAPTAIGNGTYGPDHAGSREPGGFRPGILFISPAGQPFRAAPGDPYPVATWFAQTDTNHDGQLTIGEMRDDATRFFAELDANHDGEIDPDEVTHYETVVVPEVQSGGGGGTGGDHSSGGGHHGRGMGGGGGRGGISGGGMSGGGMGGPEGGGPEEEESSGGKPQATEGLSGAAFYSITGQAEPVTSTDTNMDRSITVVEFRAAAERHFHALDTADKGYLTLADLPKTPVQQRGLKRHTHADRKRSYR